MRQLLYAMFMSNNNRISFHWWQKEDVVNHQKVSKYYENDCLQHFLLLFMSLLTAIIVKNSHISARIWFIFPKNVLKQTWKSFSIKFQSQLKDRKSSYQVRRSRSKTMFPQTIIDKILNDNGVSLFTKCRCFNYLLSVPWRINLNENNIHF